jgi:hypothetical protein
MAHLNSNLADVNDVSIAVDKATAEKARVSKPADTIYRVAAMAGAILLLVTVFWAG